MNVKESLDVLAERLPAGRADHLEIAGRQTRRSW
jgi:hypothetical protein